jgi:transmembrane sensor
MLDAGAVSNAAVDETRPLEQAVARAAAQWLMRLHSGEASSSDEAACLRWRAAHPEHERAWQRAERISHKLQIVPSEIGMGTLNRSRRMDRRALLKTLTLAISVAPASYLAWRALDEGQADAWLAQWNADAHTATGERRSLTLNDGTRIDLNTASAIDVKFSASERRIFLRSGEILIETGQDKRNLTHRPFIVETRHGSIRALGTRFLVRQEHGAATATRVAVMQGAVEIRPQASSAPPLRLAAGEQTRFNARHIDAVQAADPQAAAWTRGLLVARNQRLEDFAAELDRYRPGLLRCDPAVAELRITGAFQLDNTDNVLAALPDTLPVSVLYRTRWWVTIIPPQGQADR